LIIFVQKGGIFSCLVGDASLYPTESVKVKVALITSYILNLSFLILCPQLSSTLIRSQ